MKIIGRTDYGYLIDATKNEIANLIGYYGEYQQKEKEGIPLAIGSEIKVSNMFTQLYNLENKQPELKKVVDTLRGIADALEPTCLVIESAIKDSIKDNGETHE